MSLTTSDSTPVFADAAAYTASVPEESSLDREGWRPSGLLEWFAIGQTLLPALLFVPGNQPFRAAIRASAFLISLVTFFYWYFNRRLRPTAKHPAERWLSLACCSPGSSIGSNGHGAPSLLGSGPLESELRKWAGHHCDRVRIETGVAHADVAEHLNATDFLCAPSQTTVRWREQFGRLLIEALSCGVPCHCVRHQQERRDEQLGRAPSGICLATGGRWPLSALPGT